MGHGSRFGQDASAMLLEDERIVRVLYIQENRPIMLFGQYRRVRDVLVPEHAYMTHGIDALHQYGMRITGRIPIEESAWLTYRERIEEAIARSDPAPGLDVLLEDFVR